MEEFATKAVGIAVVAVVAVVAAVKCGSLDLSLGLAKVVCTEQYFPFHNPSKNCFHLQTQNYQFHLHHLHLH